MCRHRYPEDYGTSQIMWIDRKEGIGKVIAPCASCGTLMEWRVTA